VLFVRDEAGRPHGPGNGPSSNGRGDPTNLCAARPLPPATARGAHGRSEICDEMPPRFCACRRPRCRQFERKAHRM